MVKLLFEIVLLIFMLGSIGLFLNYVIFFWINKRRVWKREDEAFNKVKRQEALEDLMASEKLLADTQEDYLESLAYKADTPKELLVRLESK